MAFLLKIRQFLAPNVDQVYLCHTYLWSVSIFRLVGAERVGESHLFHVCVCVQEFIQIRPTSGSDTDKKNAAQSLFSLRKHGHFQDVAPCSARVGSFVTDSHL